MDSEHRALMKKLPRRTTNHKQETDSVRTFQSLLPDDWVYRIPSDDYGIDGEVEIFDDDGYPTGNKFYVQLKSTAQKDKKKALTLRLPIKSANYFEKLNLPVLIVRYLYPTNEVYWRWFHSFDRYYEKVTDNSLVMKFGSDNLWNEDSSYRINEVVNQYLDLSKGPSALPLELLVNITEESVLGEKAASFLTEFSSELNNYSQLIKTKFVSDQDKYSSAHIKIDSSQVLIVIAEKTFFNLHINSNNDLPKNFINDVFTGIGITFYRLGMPNQATAIFSNYLAHSNLKIHLDISVQALNSMVITNNLEQFLNLTEVFFNEPETYDIGQTAFAILLKFESSIIKNNLESISNRFLKISENLEKQSEWTLSSIVNYNHANLLRSHGINFRKAIKYFNIANKLSDRYQNKSYWYSEVAGCLFVLGRYKIAANFYKKAYDIDSKNSDLVLLADSLLLSGEFEESLACFHDYFNRESSDKFVAEWRLKSICLHMTIDNLGVKRNKNRLKFNLDELTTEEDITNFLMEENTLSYNAWYELAIIKADNEDFEDATMMFLMASIIKSHDINALANALRCSFKVEKPEVIASIFQYGYEIWKEDFFTYFIETTPRVDGSTQVLSMFMELMNHLKENQSPPEIELRFHDPHGGVDVFNASQSKNS